MRTRERSIGFCVRPGCVNHDYGVYLPRHPLLFICPLCRIPGRAEREEGVVRGDSDIFNEVRVEYGYDPTNGSYSGTVIARDESILGEHNSYTLRSPFIRSKWVADTAAESLLERINSYEGPVRTGKLGELLGHLSILTGYSIPSAESSASA